MRQVITVNGFKETFGDRLKPSQLEMLKRFEDLHSLEITEYILRPPVEINGEVVRKSVTIFSYHAPGIRGSFIFEFDK